MEFEDVAETLMHTWEKNVIYFLVTFPCPDHTPPLTLSPILTLSQTFYLSLAAPFDLPVAQKEPQGVGETGDRDML